MLDECESILPRDIHALDLKVFANKEAQEPLKSDGVLVSYGAYGNPLIVEVPRVWFRLVESHAAYEGTLLTRSLSPKKTVLVPYGK